MLSKEHFALALAQFFLDLRLDLFLSVEDGDLALNLNQDPPEPLFDRQGFEKRLPLGGRDVDVAGHQVGKAARLVGAREDLLDDFFGQPGLVAQFGGPLADLTVEPNERGILGIERGQLLGIADDGFEGTVALGDMEGNGAALALEQHLHSREPPLDLDNPGDGSDGIEPFGVHLLGVFSLAEGQNQLVGGGHCGLDGPDGSGSSGPDRGCDSWKQHQFPEGEDWESNSFGHGFLGTRGSALGYGTR